MTLTMELFQKENDASDNNPWFLEKKLNTVVGIKENSMGLHVPFTDIDGVFVGFQRIRLDQITNSFNSGYFSVNISDYKVISDDLAELLTIKLLHPDYQYIYTGKTTNMVAVAKSFKNKYPDSNYIVLSNSTNELEANEAIEILDAKLLHHSHGFNYVLVNNGLSTVETMITQHPELSWIKDFICSSREMNAVNDSVWLHEDLIASGHVIAIVAPPNAGKTTILTWICSQLPKDLSINYINADVSAPDAKYYHSKSLEYRFELLLPDLKPGLSTDDVFRNLVKMSKLPADLSKTVFIIDTLKKFTSVMNKSEAKTFYKLCRSLTGKGMTIVLLGHTNKYPDNEGKYVYEGTGDLRSDVDELIYLYPVKNQDGSLTVSTEIDKSRCNIKPVTFRIDANRSVTQVGYVDIYRQNFMAFDADCISAITAAIQSGLTKQSDITCCCSASSQLGVHRITAILKRYADDLWLITKGKNNSSNYSLKI